jgi:hypothetical protein
LILGGGFNAFPFYTVLLTGLRLSASHSVASYSNTSPF